MIILMMYDLPRKINMKALFFRTGMKYSLTYKIKCECCNLEMSRDLNAAINIRTAGMAGIAQQQKMVAAMPQPHCLMFLA